MWDVKFYSTIVMASLITKPWTLSALKSNCQIFLSTRLSLQQWQLAPSLSLIVVVQYPLKTFAFLLLVRWGWNLHVYQLSQDKNLLRHHAEKLQDCSVWYQAKGELSHLIVLHCCCVCLIVEMSLKCMSVVLSCI